jgi:hypothetical protein
MIGGILEKEEKRHNNAQRTTKKQDGGKMNGHSLVHTSYPAFHREHKAGTESIEAGRRANASIEMYTVFQ